MLRKAVSHEQYFESTLLSADVFLACYTSMLRETVLIAVLGSSSCGEIHFSVSGLMDTPLFSGPQYDPCSS